MKKILLVYNSKKREAVNTLKLLQTWLKDKKVSVSSVTSDSKTLPKADICIALGGDGTIIRVAKKIAPYGVPVMGKNLGSLGFLAETDPQEMREALEKVLKGDYKIEKRLLLEVEVKGKKYIAVNDCTVREALASRIVLLKVNVDNVPLTEYLGDGLIISTPTGSTAYSLAAGGPIVNPKLPVFIITPICPHTLSQRPIILSSASKITVEVPAYKSNKNINLSIDGQENIKISSGQSITIKKSKYEMKLITHPDKSYFNILRSKLNWGLLSDVRRTHR